MNVFFAAVSPGLLLAATPAMAQECQGRVEEAREAIKAAEAAVGLKGGGAGDGSSAREGKAPEKICKPGPVPRTP